MYTQSSSSTKVNDAISNYFTSLPFDGQVKISALIDVIQTIDGINDVVVQNAYGRTDIGVYEEFQRIYNTLAGYAIWDSVNSNLNYIGE